MQPRGYLLLLMVMPTGYLMDRRGPVRTCGWAFSVLILCPLGLMGADGANSMTLVTIACGIGMSGVHLAWTIGPVTLAGDAFQAAHYLAIHGTIVGFRAILGQFPAVALYRYTGRIDIPLGAAVVLLANGAMLMSRLDRDRRLFGQPPAEAVPIPPTPSDVA